MSFEKAPGRKALGIIFLIVFLDLMGTGILVPVIPYVVHPYRTDALTVGLLALAFSAAQFAASPWLGALSDRLGRRPVLLTCLLGSAGGYFLFGWAASLWMLFAARILAGFAGGSVSTAQAYIADVSKPEDRAKNFGLIGAAFGLGFIAGPALGGALSHWSIHAPAFASAILSLCTFTLALTLMPESLARDRRRDSGRSLRDMNPFSQLGGALGRAELRDLMLAYFALNFPMAGLQSNFAVFTHVRFGLTAPQNAVLFAFLGVMAALTQGVLLRKLAPKMGEPRLALWGAAFYIAGLAVLAASTAMWMIYASIALISLGFGIAGPALSGLISRRVSDAEQGRALGTAQSVASLTRVVGPVWAGAVFDHVGTGSPYWTGAAWALLAMLWSWHAVRGRRAERAAQVSQ